MEKKMEATIVYGGYIRMMEKKMEATIEHIRCFIRIMEKKMEATIEHIGGFLRIMEKKMETTIDVTMLSPVWWSISTVGVAVLSLLPARGLGFRV